MPTLSEIAPYVARPPKVQLRPYQRDIANFAIMTPCCGLFLQMGAGKTLICLEVLHELGDCGNTLVVGPKPTIRATWPDEHDKWGFEMPMISLVSDEKGRPLSREARHELISSIRPETSNIYLINRELLCDLIDTLKGRWPFANLVLDEAQAFKSPKAKRFRALKQKREHTRRVIELTGTPAPNGLQDLWALAYLLDGGARLCPYITHFRQAFCIAINRGDYIPPEYVITPEGEARIKALLSDITVSADVVKDQLPPVINNDITVTMTPKSKRLYKRLKKEAVLAFRNGDVIDVDDLSDDYDMAADLTGDARAVKSGEHVSVAANRAVLSAKLAQLASGALYVDGTHDYVTVHTEKVEMLRQIINDSPSPVLVAYHFKSDADMIETHIGNDEDGNPIEVRRFDGSPEMVHAWNEREIPVMLVQPASAGHGLNLQYGGNTLVWYTLPWSLEEYQQTCARLARPGQPDTVYVHHLLCENTVDSMILKKLQSKGNVQQGFMDVIDMELAKY